MPAARNKRPPLNVSFMPGPDNLFPGLMEVRTKNTAFMIEFSREEKTVVI
jgi:hypothetical protein